MHTNSDALDWSIAAADVQERGVSRERAADAAERAEVARQLDLVGCERLVVQYTLKAASRGRYLLDGGVQADIVQACVVTLEPIKASLSENFSIEFWPQADADVACDGETEILDVPDVEPIDNGVLRIGRVFYEVLAGAIDPYPRKADAAFDDDAGQGGKEGDAPGPFAALARLKGGPPPGQRSD